MRELAQRDYASVGDRPAVDYVLLFLPNESIAGFIYESDPGLVEHALGQKVVLCSPLTLFAFLGVIRQAFDNFVIEQTSDEILTLLGKFGQQWEKYAQSLESVERKFSAVHKELEHLGGPRRRMLEKPLLQLNELRRKRGLEIDSRLRARAGGGRGPRAGGLPRRSGGVSLNAGADAGGRLRPSRRSGSAATAGTRRRSRAHR